MYLGIFRHQCTSPQARDRAPPNTGCALAGSARPARALGQELHPQRGEPLTVFRVDGALLGAPALIAEPVGQSLIGRVDGGHLAVAVASLELHQLTEALEESVFKGCAPGQVIKKGSS